jgi:hypothetical protein
MGCSSFNRLLASKALYEFEEKYIKGNSLEDAYNGSSLHLLTELKERFFFDLENFSREERDFNGLCAVVSLKSPLYCKGTKLPKEHLGLRLFYEVV